MMRVHSLLMLLLVTSLTVGCASSPSNQQNEQAQPSTADPNATDNDLELAENEHNVDPFEPVNRVVWDFNYEVLDRFILKPITKVYVNYTPQAIRDGLVNASENIEEPANSINNLLQGKVEASMTSLARFAVNSTVGVLGIFDVASGMELEQKEEDFGQVLGVWGVGTGPYLMLPALGPSDIRSFTGNVVDNYYWPATVLRDPIVIGAAVVSILETRAMLLDQEEQLNRALDQYLFVRDAYFQRLAFEVSDGKVEEKSQEELEEEADDFSDFEDLLNGGAL